MRIPSLILTCCVCAAFATPAGAAAARAPVTAAAWLSQVQSAPGRQALPMSPQQDVSDTLALANGEVVVAGTVNGRLVVSELLPDGRPNPAFGQDGVLVTSIKLLPWQLLSLPGGEIMVLGPSRIPGAQEPIVTEFPDWQLLRLRSDGTPDPSFGRAGLLTAAGVRVASEGPSSGLQPQTAPGGAIVLPTIIGPVLSPSTVSALVRLNPDGSRDSSFATGGTLQLPGGLAEFSVLAGGATAIVVRSSTGTALARLTAAGAVDPAFNGGAWAQVAAYGVDAMLVQADGGILLHGYPAGNALQGARVWRYTAAGSPDASWGSAGASAPEPTYGYINELLPSSQGTTLLVTTGITYPYRVTASTLRVTRLTAGGQVEPSPGSPGMVTAAPFGGGTYQPGRVVSLSQNSFEPNGVIQRADGTLMVSGLVGATESFNTDAGPEDIAWIYSFGLAALNASFSPDPSFGGAPPTRVSVRVTSTRLNPRGVAVRLSSSRATFAVVTISALGRTIAKGTVPFFGRGEAVPIQLARIPLNRAGRALLCRHLAHVTVSVGISASSLAGSRVGARTAARLAG